MAAEHSIRPQARSTDRRPVLIPVAYVRFFPVPLHAGQRV